MSLGPGRRCLQSCGPLAHARGLKALDPAADVMIYTGDVACGGRRQNYAAAVTEITIVAAASSRLSRCPDQLAVDTGARKESADHFSAAAALGDHDVRCKRPPEVPADIGYPGT